MRTVHRNLRLTFGIGAGGLLTAAFLPIAVALADQYDFTPDITTFVPTQVEGFPPLINEVTGAEQWNIFDLTTNTVFTSNVLDGTDTQTTIGSFTNDDHLTNIGLAIIGNSSSFHLPSGVQIDLANFGLGFENEWIDVPSGSESGVSDLFITPFGDFTLFGTAFSDLSTVLTP
jgi:hypothetical protein